MKSTLVVSKLMIQERRDDARFFLPREFSVEDYPSVKWCQLTKLATVPKRNFTANKPPNREKIFNLINVADVDEKEGTIKEVHSIKGSEVRGTKSLAKAGELIFARIEPSIYNKKSAIVPNNISELICSTELIVLSPKRGVDPAFLLWILRSDWFASQVTENLMRGSTGRRRLSYTDLLRLYVPDIPSEVQWKVAEMVAMAHHEREKKLIEADDVLRRLDKDVKKIIQDNSLLDEGTVFKDS
jgi:hypothetical protein